MPKIPKVKNITPEANKHNLEVEAHVGNLIVNYATVETIFTNLIQELLKTTQDNAVIVFHSFVSTRATFNLIKRLAYVNLDKDKYENVAKIIKRMKYPTTIRNHYAHSEYYRDLGTGAFLETVNPNLDMIEEGKPLFNPKPLDEKAWHEINQAIKNLDKIANDLWILIHEISGKE